MVERRGAMARQDLLALGGKGVEVYTPPAPVKQVAKVESGRRRERRRAIEPAALRAWRARMVSEAGRAVHRRRMRVEEVNGIVKRRGLVRLAVCGLVKVWAVALPHALAHDLWRGHRLARMAG